MIETVNKPILKGVVGTSVMTSTLGERTTILFWLVLNLKIVFDALFLHENLAAATFIGNLVSLCFFLYLLSQYMLLKSVYRQPPSVTRFCVVGFMIWSGLSLTWTYAFSPLRAAGYWGGVIVEISSIFLLLGLFPIDDVFQGTLKGILYSGLTVGLTALQLGFDQNGRLGDDTFLHPNVIGNSTGQGALAALYLWQASKRNEKPAGRWAVSFCVLLLMLLRTSSKTSVIAILLGLTIFLIKSHIPTARKATLILALIVPIAIGAPAFMDYLDNYVNLQTESGSSVETASGRTTLWAETMDRIIDRPILGFGFMSFPDVGPQLQGINLVSPHDEWLTLWFNEGLVGMLLGFGVYVGLLVQAVRHRSKSLERTFCFALLGYGFIETLTHSSTNALVIPIQLLLVLSSWLAVQVTFRKTA